MGRRLRRNPLCYCLKSIRRHWRCRIYHRELYFGQAPVSLINQLCYNFFIVIGELLNTLLFEHELAEAARAIEVIAKSGADGLIVQDFTAVRMAREIAPDLALHGSTQMSITDARGVQMAHDLGVERVTLARE